MSNQYQDNNSNQHRCNNVEQRFVQQVFVEEPMRLEEDTTSLTDSQLPPEILDSELVLGDGEIEFLRQCDISSNSNFLKKYYYGLCLFFHSVLFCFRTKIYKTFIVDWIRVFVLDIIVVLFIILGELIGHSVFGFGKLSGLGITFIVVGSVLAGVGLIAGVVDIVFTILRIDSLRRIRFFTKQAIDQNIEENGGGVPPQPLWCPPCNKDCGDFQGIFRLIHIFEFVIFLFIFLISFSMIPFGAPLFVILFFYSLIGFRTVFCMNKEKSYFSIYSFWISHLPYVLGIGTGYMLVMLVPIFGMFAFPILTVCSVRMYFHIRYLEGGEEQSSENTQVSLVETHHLQGGEPFQTGLNFKNSIL